ncbi:hypothetical protein ACODNH_00595 (plasmid) [Haloarcula sp. NS06]|uniref:hypothetical protein n=1 Tax=Haloarcula sp. NS06 TaxID=3409688 RepID=UPI003DA7942E
MVDLRVAGSSFTSFDAAEGTLGVDVGRVRDALSVGDAGDLAQFALDAAKQHAGNQYRRDNAHHRA